MLAETRRRFLEPFRSHQATLLVLAEDLSRGYVQPQSDAGIVEKGGNEQLGTEENDDRPQLNRKQALALEFIRVTGPKKAVLIARHVEIEESTFRTHYLPKLRYYGVISTDDGYVVEGAQK